MDILYKNILEKLSTNIPELAWIDYDSGQIDNFGNNYPIPFPAVLIDFSESDWEDVGQNLQCGDVTIDIRIAFRLWQETNNHTPAESRNEGLLKLQLQNKIFSYLQGLSGEHYNALSRIRQYTEKRDDGLKVIVMQFITNLRDSNALKKYTEHKVDNLDITV